MIHSDELIYVSLTKDALDLSAAFDFINLQDCGGNSIFVGTTRGYEEDGQKRRVPIDGLFYEAYEQMAFKEMIKIVHDMMNRNVEIKRCYVAHRLGVVQNGAASIIIATCSRGRQDCANETMNLLCQIKERVPVFKKIILSNNESLNDTHANVDELTSHNKTSDNQLITRQSQTSDQKSLLCTNWIMKSELFWLKKV